MRGRLLRVPLLLAGLALGLVGCGTATQPTETVSSPSTTPAVDDGTPDPQPSPGPSEEPSPAPGTSPVELAGEPYEGPPLGGRPGRLAVVGVAADDVLNVREEPGTDAAVVTTLDPLASEVAATGRARLLSTSIWLEVEVDGVTGWANSSFFAHLGATDDITARVLEDAGDRPSAPTLEELADAVATVVASQDPPSRVVVSAGPDGGDLGEVTVDVIGLADDAVMGLRLVVFATVDPDGFTLRTVEATALCGRGVTADGICV